MIKFFQKLKAKKGFTLVELIVVIAIIGVLAAILVPTMLGYVTSSRVTSADTTAAKIEDTVDTFLTQADTAGYGMKLSDTSTSVITISVTNTGWAVTVGGAGSAFKSTATTSWTSNATVTTADTKVAKSSDATALLGLSLQSLFPDIKSAYVEAYVKAGNVEYVFYTADATSDTDLSDMKGSYNTSGSFTASAVSLDKKVCKWDDNTAGINANGLIVGTSPALGLGTP